MTIRLRLTVWYGLTFVLLLSLAGALVFLEFQGRMHRSLEGALRIHAEDLVADVREGDQAIDVVEPATPGVFAVLLSPEGEIVESSPGTPPDLPQLPPGATSRRLTASGLAYAFFALRLSDGRTLITGSSLASVDRSISHLGELLVLIGLTCTAASLVGGWWLAGRSLAPVARMTREADSIGPGDLHRRLSTGQPADEIGRLAATIDRLLSRIEDGMTRERSLIAGAAHDLRTPIAALRMQLDLLLRGGEVEGPARASLEDARKDAVTLSELADALLGLADAQSRGPQDVVEEVVLPTLVARAEQAVERLAGERTVRIEQRVDEMAVRISPVRFHQALTNLLANAVRHGPVGGTVELEARLDTALRGDRDRVPVVMVEVADRGPGIAPEARKDLFVPFALPRRSAFTAHGLGLATAAAAVRSQEGEIGYRDRPGGGSIFWFWLPLAMHERIATPTRSPR